MGGNEKHVRYYKRDFWGVENLKFAKPNFRAHRVAPVLRSIARRRDCDLLDVGCGPGALQRMLPGNIRYHGIDIAITDPAPNLRESDITASPIEFDGKKFDIVIMLGVFEYLGEFQKQKLAEVRNLLKPGGRFLVTYTNFSHRKATIYERYNNVQPPREFRRDLASDFVIHREFPTAYNWNHTYPNRAIIQAMQPRFPVSVPVAGTKLAIDRLYVCQARR